VLQPALLGGLFIGVLSALPIVSIGNCCCCLWIVGGGMVAAYLDQQNNPQPITVARGARAGVLAGIVGAFVWLVVSLALDPVLAPMQEWLLSQVADSARDMPPEARELFESLTRRDSGSSGYAAGFALLLCAGSIFSTVGGVIGAVYFRNDIPPALGGPITP
jgi:hypothetical protein